MVGKARSRVFVLWMATLVAVGGAAAAGGFCCRKVRLCEILVHCFSRWKMASVLFVVCALAMCLTDKRCMFDVYACDGYVYPGSVA